MELKNIQNLNRTKTYAKDYPAIGHKATYDQRSGPGKSVT
jgi:hypothetical protein